MNEQDDACTNQLEDIAQAGLNPQAKLEAQILAIIREYNRTVVLRPAEWAECLHDLIERAPEIAFTGGPIYAGEFKITIERGYDAG